MSLGSIDISCCRGYYPLGNSRRLIPDPPPLGTVNRTFRRGRPNGSEGKSTYILSVEHKVLGVEIVEGGTPSRKVAAPGCGYAGCAWGESDSKNFHF